MRGFVSFAALTLLIGITAGTGMRSAAAEPMSEARADISFANPANEFAAYRKRAANEGFAVVEGALLSSYAAAAPADRQGALKAVVHFYMAHGLYAEALSIMAEQDQETLLDELVFLNGVANYKMGRFNEAADIFSSKQVRGLNAAAPWRGMANAQRGAYEAAADDLFSVTEATHLFDGEAPELFLLKAGSAIALGQYKVARNALNAVRQFPLNDEARAKRSYLEAQWMLANGRREAARATLAKLTKNGAAPIANLAALGLLKDAVKAGNMTPRDAAEKAEALRLTWRGGAFEREILSFRAAMLSASGDIAGAFDVRRLLVRAFGEADDSKEALRVMRADLAKLFDQYNLAPLDAAKIFYENIDLAPPGREGDELIRDVADDLTALDLTAQAAELLHHQTFYRLRGEQRSVTAADLAELYLKNNEPGEALRVLRSTRLARLPDAVNDRRRHLEARALIETGKPAAALAFLENDRTAAGAALRGEIYWTQEDWVLAGDNFEAAVFEKSENEKLTRLESGFLMRAASAYVLAGEREKLLALGTRGAGKFETEAGALLMRDLAAGDFRDGPRAFLDAYRDFFNLNDAAS